MSRLLLLACFTAIALFILPISSALAATPTVDVLFVGNSYTYVNDLPKMLEALSRAGRKRIKTERVTAGGYTLKRHWDDKKAARKIASRRWDYVVLQEQSQLPFVNPPMMIEAATKLDAAIDERGAKTLLFLTWARAHQPEKQQALNKSYQQAAQKCDAEVVPVGIAFEAALALNNQPRLHQKDNSHPSPAGTYLAACVFYAVLFDESPEGLPGKVAGLSDLEAGRLQKVAWETAGKMRTEAKTESAE